MPTCSRIRNYYQLPLLRRILWRVEPLPGNDRKQTGSHGNESTRNNRGTVGSGVFCGPRSGRCYTTARLKRLYSNECRRNNRGTVSGDVFCAVRAEGL
jgi:hypothetical protein